MVLLGYGGGKRVELEGNDVLVSDRNSLASHLQETIESQKAALSRELHDDLGGLLVGALMDVAWIEAHGTESPEVDAKLRRARQSLRAAVDLKRRLIEEMRPTLLDNVGLFAALKWHLAHFCEVAKINCTSDFPEDELTLKPEQAIGGYRAIEEALQLMTASLDAKSIDLEATVEDSDLCLRLSHDGKNADLLADHPVFASMNHRITRLRGTVTIKASSGGSILWSLMIPGVDSSEH